MLKNKKGFTLVEIIVVLIILAVLIAIAVPTVFKYIDDANDAKILAQASPVLNAAKSEAVSMYAEGTLDSLPNDELAHKKIMDIAEINGKLIKIELNDAKTSCGDFIVEIQDRYIYYDYKKQVFTLIKGEDIEINSESINNALLSEIVLKDILTYFKDRPGANSLDSEGPNFGSTIKTMLTSLGLNADTYSFRIWSKGNENTITIGPKLSVDMVGQEVQVTRYDYGNAKDFSSEPTIKTATVKVEIAKTTDRNGLLVEYAVYKLENAQWSDT